MSVVSYQLQDSLLQVPGIGPTTYLKLSKRGLFTVNDLLRVYPTRYEDYSVDARIATLETGDRVTITAVVVKSKNTYTRKRGLTIQNLVVKDNTGELELTWFNQPFILKAFKIGVTYRFSGKVTAFKNRETLVVGEFELADTPKISTGRIVPIYSEAFGVSSKFLRKIIKHLLNHLNRRSLPVHPSSLPENFRLLDEYEALLSLHFPKSHLALSQAQEHYLLNELLIIKLNHLRQAKKIATRTFPLLTNFPQSQNQFIDQLPFKLTPSQSQVIESITALFKAKEYFNHLLMGDVGSGKTVIISYLCYLMGLSGLRTLILVPTEALAEQHFETLNRFLGFSKIKIAILTGTRKTADISSTEVIIGTQALFYKTASLPPFGLLIIDEQHKFGVSDREKLLTKIAPLPHLLTVSATPIPRSLAQSLYGEITTSYLTDKPYKTSVKTFLVKEEKREASYKWIEKVIREEKVQAFVICASIEAKETPSANEIKAVKAEYQKLVSRFPTLSIGAIYSKHPQKTKILAAFRRKELDILVSTSLIEVGIDIPEASLMIIENAERFGLSQLHQMRGRIGRREQQAYCLLFSSGQNPDTLKRLHILETTSNALEIAQKDLELRGPGDLMGTQQHGFSFITLESLLDEKLTAKVNALAKNFLLNTPL